MTAEQLSLGEPLVNSVGMIFVPVPAGEFQMGTSAAVADGKRKINLPPGGESEQPAHHVRITQPFFIGVCEVTQGQFRQVMDQTPWKGQPLTTEGELVAASYITWDQADAFCRKLSEAEGAVYRLPTEAEWEYICRGGSATSYSFGEDATQIEDYAWLDQNAYKAEQQYAHTVAKKLPNPWSLYDVHGNVWEWCSDWHGDYKTRLKASRKNSLTDPTGPDQGRQRVWRGGGFAENAVNLRSASRNSYGRVDYRPEFMAGFRVVREMK